MVFCSYAVHGIPLHQISRLASSISHWSQVLLVVQIAFSPSSPAVSHLFWLEHCPVSKGHATRMLRHWMQNDSLDHLCYSFPVPFFLLCRHWACLVCVRYTPLLIISAANSPTGSFSCCSRPWPYWLGFLPYWLWLSLLPWTVSALWLTDLCKYCSWMYCDFLDSDPKRLRRGLEGSIRCWIPLMPKITYPSLPLSVSISQQPGPRSTLICSSWYSCFQARNFFFVAEFF